jgi:hypothetical protein
MDRQEYPRVIMVMLRQPRSDRGESRTDPIWEVGSFGSTGCHTRNLMNPSKIEELNGARFAFVQGGPSGLRLVHVTPPVKGRRIRSGECGEVHWEKHAMPLNYGNSPCVINNDGHSDVPLILDYIRWVARSTWIARFASAFRTRRMPLAGVVGDQVVAAYDTWRKKHPEAVAKTYVDALPWPPPLVESALERKTKYRKNIGATSGKTAKNCSTKDSVCKKPPPRRRC